MRTTSLQKLVVGAAVLAAVMTTGCRKKRHEVEVYQTRTYRVDTVPQPEPQPEPHPEPAGYAIDDPQSADLFADEQLDEMLAPIALYPDALLADVLTACTYPTEIAEAWQWVQNHENASDAAIESRTWEPSVKAVAHFPTVLKMLAGYPEWARTVGAAFLRQPDDVLRSIQRLRAAAVTAETLETTPQQQVVYTDNSYIEILPASPEVIYVPVYDPVLVYVRRPSPVRIRFSVRLRTGRWLGRCVDWRRRAVCVGAGWHPHWRYTHRKWHPAHRSAVVTHGRKITRVVHKTTVVGPIYQPWKRNAAKPRPRVPATPLVPRPGFTSVTQRRLIHIRPRRSSRATGGVAHRPPIGPTHTPAPKLTPIPKPAPTPPRRITVPRPTRREPPKVTTPKPTPNLTPKPKPAPKPPRRVTVPRPTRREPPKVSKPKPAPKPTPKPAPAPPRPTVTPPPSEKPVEKPAPAQPKRKRPAK